MIEQKISQTDKLAAFLVGIRRQEHRQTEADEHLEELASLVDTMGAQQKGSLMANLNRPTAAYLLGEGKVDEIKAHALAADAKVIVVDDDLSPAQQRNWEKLTGLAVIDRREVILDIFAQRAQTREARLQVELARLQYSLPRLKRAWLHLERQRGGGGFIGGAGEAQIEIDRRIVRDNIARCRKELESVRKQRATQRKSRQGKPVPTAAIVGYTNSGKSTLLNALTEADVLAEDKLFATLDPVTRRIQLPNSQALLLTDTVGFIRKLPHMLVDAFRATLEEACVADFLVHVVDASHPAAHDHIMATNEVLAELEIDNKPTIFVFNKMDLVEDPIAVAALRAETRHSILTSVHHGTGLDELRQKLADFAAGGMLGLLLRIPSTRHDIVGLAYREGRVTDRRQDGTDVIIEVSLPIKCHAAVAPWIVTPEEEARYHAHGEAS